MPTQSCMLAHFGGLRDAQLWTLSLLPFVIMLGTHHAWTVNSTFENWHLAFGEFLIQLRPARCPAAKSPANASVVLCSAPVVAPSVSTAAAVQSPFMQSKQQQQHQQQQLQFLANALQLQSQLKAHTQNQPGVPIAGMCSVHSSLMGSCIK